MIKKLLALAAVLFLNVAAFAGVDLVIKEETTPPPPEGALTAEQVPPIDSSKHKLPAPSSEPQFQPSPVYNAEAAPAAAEQAPVPVRPSDSTTPSLRPAINPK